MKFKTDLKYLPETVKEKILETKVEDNVELAETKSGSYSIIKNKQRVYSIYSPLEEVKRFISKFDITEKKIIILLGFGLGYHFLEIVNNYKFKKLFIIDYNFDILKIAFQNYDFNTYFEQENIIFLDVINENNFIDRLAEVISVDNFKDIQIIKIEKLLNSEIEQFKLSLLWISKLYNFRLINISTTLKFSRQWQEHTLKNLLRIAPTKNVLHLKDSLENVPFLIIAAGPSLENKLDYIKRLKGKIIIAVVDTAAKVLFDNDIIPDILAVADSQKSNYELIKDLDLSDTFVLTNLIVYPELFKTVKSENIIIYNSNTPVLDWFSKTFNEDIGHLKTGGSVSTVLFSYSLYCGCNPIIFVGQDLSYPEMKIYSRGTKKEEDIFKILNKFNSPESKYFSEYFKENQYIVEQDINNNPVMTTKILKGYRDWIVQESKYYNNKEFINLSKSGILKENFTQSCIEELFKKYQNNDIIFRNLLEKEISDFHFSYYNLISEYKELLKEFIKLKENIESFLENFNTFTGLTSSLEFEINNMINFYNNCLIKIFIDYNIQDYLLYNKENSLDYLKILFEKIFDETEFFILVLNNLVYGSKSY